MDYLEALSRAHGLLRPRNYVEIGCRSGHSLAVSRSPSIGIDPDFEITAPLLAPTRLYRMTSDEFFRTHDVGAILGEPIDLAFIDGMHHAECALRDFIHLERQAARRGVIVIDDVLPGDMRHATRERNTQVWTGDVYKLVLILRRFRPDLVIDVFDVELKGFCLVSRLDPQSRVLADGYGRHEADVAAGRYTLPDVATLRDAIAPAPVETLGRRLTELAHWRDGAGADQPRVPAPS